jgi:hypothetical protein
MWPVIVIAILLPMLLAAAFLLGRHLNRRQLAGEQLSLVTRQHIYLFQGGQLNEALVEATKTRFRDLLERGEVAAVEASLRPGVQYVIGVRALTEIGTEVAGRILERQLQRRLSEDQLEQSWYMIDLANGLRCLNRQESLPHLLRCAETAGEVPLGHFFAAETVCFLGFAGYLRDRETPLGDAALRVLHRALEGLRLGVQPQMVIEARLGEAIEQLWDHRPETVHPVLVRIFIETLRLIRRAPHAQAAFGLEGTEQESFNWQVSRLTALESVLQDYLEEAPALLGAKLTTGTAQTARDVLQALVDLRAETAPLVLPLLSGGNYPHADLAVESLSWSRDPHVGPWLRQWVNSQVPAARRRPGNRGRLLPTATRVPAGFPYAVILRALRGHPGKETEDLLLQAARDWDAAQRQAALSSLGWWEPVQRAEVLGCLQLARRDYHPGVRQAARAALARLGERQSLQWFRQALTSEDAQQVHEAVQVIATEGLTLLWPDLDNLTEADNPDVAHHAREAVERLFEDMEWRLRK